MEKWYVGQPIVAITNHSQGRFKKNQEFKIKAINMAPCLCNRLVLDIGLNLKDYSIKKCTTCGMISNFYPGYGEDNFAPLDVNISELTEILEKEQTQILTK